MRFGIVTDTHYANIDPVEDRYFRDSLEKMAVCIETMNREKVDFLIMLGDIKDQDPDPVETNTLLYLAEIESAFRKFEGPCYHVLGNHDMDSISREQYFTLVENSGIAAGKGHYSFQHNDVTFLVLDACYRPDGVPYNNGDFDWMESFIPKEQLEWLEAALQNNSRETVVFTHQLLDMPGKYGISNADAVNEILVNTGNVRTVFQGHYHKARQEKLNGINYYTLAAMVVGQGKENATYAIVELLENGAVKVNGYGAAEDAAF